LTQEQFVALDRNGDGYLSRAELMAALDRQCKPVFAAADAVITCDDLLAAQDALRAAFATVRAEDGCGTDLTDFVKVRRIVWLKDNRRFEDLNLEDIAGKIKDFDAGEYDYSIGKTQKLFHYYLLFRPGVYRIFYEIDEEVCERYGVTAMWEAQQKITIDDQCSGCLGCLGCDACARCRDRYIPEYAVELKRMLGDWLLVGLSLLVLLSPAGHNRS